MQPDDIVGGGAHAADAIGASTVVSADESMLAAVRGAAPVLGAEGLSRQAYARFRAAQMKTAWGQRHQRRRALVHRGQVLATATQYDLTAVLDHRRVAVCGIGDIVPQPVLPAAAAARELVHRLLEQAARDGAAMALVFSEGGHEPRLDGFDVIPTADVDITVAEPLRRGAPMTLIRGGEERDLAAIAAMGQVRAEPFRFHLDRDTDLVQYAITKKRLLAGLGTAGARQLHFFIAEEGITAAAYVVVSIVGGTWTIEECGDRDPSGARVGAILQALIAREPVERRPTIAGWLPRGFVPPQVTIVAEAPSKDVMMVRFLDTAGPPPRLSGDDVLYWRSDIF